MYIRVAEQWQKRSKNGSSKYRILGIVVPSWIHYIDDTNVQ